MAGLVGDDRLRVDLPRAPGGGGPLVVDAVEEDVPVNRLATLEDAERDADRRAPAELPRALVGIVDPHQRVHPVAGVPEALRLAAKGRGVAGAGRRLPCVVAGLNHLEGGPASKLGGARGVDLVADGERPGEARGVPGGGGAGEQGEQDDAGHRATSPPPNPSWTARPTASRSAGRLKTSGSVATSTAPAR